jgi:hypothetical protein
VIDVFHEQSYDPLHMLKLAKHYQSFLLNSFDSVFFCAADELIIKDPAVPFSWLLIQSRFGTLRCRGYNLIDPMTDQPFDVTKPLFEQRQQLEESARYSKVIGGNTRTYWHPGFFTAANFSNAATPADDYLCLVHLHKMDLDLARERHADRGARHWEESMVDNPLYRHNHVSAQETLSALFRYSTDDIAFLRNPPRPIRLAPATGFVKEALEQL